MSTVGVELCEKRARRSLDVRIPEQALEEIHCRNEHQDGCAMKRTMEVVLLEDQEKKKDLELC